VSHAEIAREYQPEPGHYSQHPCSPAYHPLLLFRYTVPDALLIMLSASAGTPLPGHPRGADQPPWPLPALGSIAVAKYVQSERGADIQRPDDHQIVTTATLNG
jgi:hypothetical protein